MKQTSFDPVLLDAELEAPFAVSRLFAGMSDRELRCFCLLAAGLRAPEVAERLDLDPQDVRSVMRRLKPVLEWLSEFLPESERERAEAERKRAMDERYERYLATWDRVMDKAEEKLEAGDSNVLSMLLKDLAQRNFGPVVQKTKHEEKRTVEFRNVPAAIGARIGKLIDVTPDD